jgi:thioredoxin-related protein
MKKILILALTIFSLSISAQEINWITFEEAIEAQKTTPKKIFVDAYAIWCGPCKMLDKNTFSNKDVADYINKNYYAVKFDAQGNKTINFKGKTYTNPNFIPNTSGRNSNHELSAVFQIRAFPTLLFLDEKADLIAPIPGYKTPQQLELYLKLFKTDDHKKITEQNDWENYQANFTPEFKD